MRWPRLRSALTPVVELARTYGARGLARRSVHEVLHRSGLLARLDVAPSAPPPALRLPTVDRVTAAAVLAREPAAAAGVVDRARGILDGRYPYFGDVVLDEPWPPRWHHHPRTGVDWPSDRPWPSYAHLPPEAGDIKWLWEPARFHFAWVLPRAWAVTGERRFADETWRGLRDWLAHNPPGRGVGWYCAQELSLRCFALLFAASTFATAGLAPAEDLARLAGLFDAAAHRIARTLGHSLSQRNNHALSEAVALWTLGHVLDGAPRAARWRAQGAAALRECLADQFAADGAYIQESLNYHRLAVHVLLWARFVGRSLGVSVPAEVEPALRRSYELLRGLCPVAGGELPNYGHNDGALLLALASGPFRDVRPTLQHLARELGEPLPWPPGPWDEPAAWLGLGAGSAPVARPLPEALRITASGYVTSRRGAWMVMSRIPHHAHHRPGQADALQVDVWHRDRNVALDPGSFAYSEPPPWDNALVETRVHNTCSAGDRSQMRRRGRFLWTDWSQARLHDRLDSGGVSMWLASVRCAWGRDLVHTRLVRHDVSQLDVLDLIEGGDADVRRLHWNLDGTRWQRIGDRWRDGDLVVTIAAADDAAIRAVSADPASVLGWTSPTYGMKLACTTIEAESGAARAWFHTRFTSGELMATIDDDALAAWRRGAGADAFRQLAIQVR